MNQLLKSSQPLPTEKISTKDDIITDDLEEVTVEYDLNYPKTVYIPNEATMAEFMLGLWGSTTFEDSLYGKVWVAMNKNHQFCWKHEKEEEIKI